MSFENPLDHIRKMNAENEAKREQEQEEALKQEQLNQENTDEMYTLKQETKDTLSQSVEDFKKRIKEINGTQEEMIAQYRETIKEAKKNPETLQYVRDNFDEIFAVGKEKWREASSEKIGNIDSIKRDEEVLNKLSIEIEHLYPKTTEAKENKQEEERKEKMIFEVKKIMNQGNSQEIIEKGLNRLENYAQRIKDESEIYISNVESVIKNNENLKHAALSYAGNYKFLGEFQITVVSNAIEPRISESDFLDTFKRILDANKDTHTKVLVPSMEYIYEEFQKRTSIIENELNNFSGNKNQAYQLIESLSEKYILPKLNLTKEKSWENYPLLEE